MNPLRALDPFDSTSDWVAFGITLIPFAALGIVALHGIITKPEDHTTGHDVEPDDE